MQKNLRADKIKVISLGIAEILSIALIPFILFWGFLLLFIFIGTDFILTRFRYLKMRSKDRWILVLGYIVIAIYFVLVWIGGGQNVYIGPSLVLLFFFIYTKICEIREIRRIGSLRGGRDSTKFEK